MKVYTFYPKDYSPLMPKYDVVITNVSTPKDYGIKLMNRKNK